MTKKVFLLFSLSLTISCGSALSISPLEENNGSGTGDPPLFEGNPGENGNSGGEGNGGSKDDSLAGGIKASKGSGGTIGPGQSANTAGGATIYVPTSYNPKVRPSGVIFLIHMQIKDFKFIADKDSLFVVDTNQYPSSPAEQQLVVDRYQEALGILTNQYNLEQAKVYIAGWSAGGNFALLGATSPDAQQEIAGIMVFPGTGGNRLLSNCQQNIRRKMAFYYAVGDQDTSTGYARGVPNEASVIGQVSGYQDRVRYKVWAGRNHDLVSHPTLGPPVIEEAWNFLRQFNSVTN